VDNTSLMDRAYHALQEIHKEIGDCELIAREYMNGCIWRQIEFKPGKFDDALTELIKDIKESGVYYFKKLPNPYLPNVNSFVVDGYGISIRIEQYKKWNVKESEWNDTFVMDYCGWRK
jgi:hypothetical protein